MKAQHDFLMFSSTINDLSDNLPKSRGDCFDVGINGGCGLRCVPFTEGRCEEPQEFTVESLEEEFNEDELKEIKAYYPNAWKSD